MIILNTLMSEQISFCADILPTAFCLHFDEHTALDRRDLLIGTYKKKLVVPDYIQML